MLIQELHAENIAVAVGHPHRVRDFAKGVGWDAKTDPVDAKVIAGHGEVVCPKPSVAKNKLKEELQNERSSNDNVLQHDSVKTIRTSILLFNICPSRTFDRDD